MYGNAQRGGRGGIRPDEKSGRIHHQRQEIGLLTTIDAPTGSVLGTKAVLYLWEGVTREACAAVARVDQYSQKIRCSSLLSWVLVIATIARIRAFCGFRS